MAKRKSKPKQRARKTPDQRTSGGTTNRSLGPNSPPLSTVSVNGPISYIRPEPVVPAPRYKPKAGGLIEKASATVRPTSKQRTDLQRDRVKTFRPRGSPLSVNDRKSKAELAAFNAERRNKRNSSGFSFDVDCVQKPSGSSGAQARWDPTPKQRADQKSRSKKQEHARRWC